MQYKLIRPVRSQQNIRRETANSILERGRPQDIMRRCKQGNKHYTVARVRIWRNALVTWEETLLPGNVARLLNTRGSAHTHERINEGRAQRLPGGTNRDNRNTRPGKPFQRQVQ